MRDLLFIPLYFPCIIRLNAIFFSTVSQGNRVDFWNIMPRSGDGSVISFPSTVIFPVVGMISPATSLRIVDFPQPDGPTRLTNSPLPILRSMALRA